MQIALEMKEVDYQWEYGAVPWYDAVLLSTSGGMAVGRIEEVELGENQFELEKLANPSAPVYPTGLFYEELVQR